ncbi:YfhO family protein [Ruminococcus sp. zg-924]|uniref:YfhO family protein n=1 Tax=Ruminococcus sp. zg-924 TaxID=2678505 RepID=UPI00210E2390|nr:YfhO family protein [Ruminococcus sp. zg-924]
MKASRLPQYRIQDRKFKLLAFFMPLAMALFMFLPFLVYDYGLFLYYGDFNVQQIPFYQMIHDSILSGNIGWSNTTDLGANIIGSYTFYNLGSPFFWLTLLFPSEAVPYMMAPLLMLKMSLASLGAYLYLRRYVRNKHYAVIGGILYAFSGFSIYNIFFNHFHEAILVFPFLLAAIDEYMETNRRGIVALAVFCACLFNYYFFVGQVVFVVIYWFLRVITGGFKVNLRVFVRLAVEVVIGFAATAVLLVPTVLAVTQNPRVSNAPAGWDALLYSPVQRYMHIFTSMFFLPDIPARPNFTPGSGSKWASISLYLPLFGMTGTIAFLQSKKYTSWIKKLIVLLLVFAFVPILNSAFQMFNAVYYARWFYMLTLIMVLATVKALDSTQINWKRSLIWSTVITLAVAVGIGFMPYTERDSETKQDVTKYGLMEYPDRFWAYVAISLICIAILFVILQIWKKDRNKFIKVCYACVCVVSVASSLYLLTLGKAHSYNTHSYIIPHVINKQDEINLPDTDVARSDFYECMDNVPMFYQIPTIQAFHSIVPGSVMEFYPKVGVTRDVGSRPDTTVYGLRSFLSVHWLFDYVDDSNSFEDSDGKMKMPGYEYYGRMNGYSVYENKYYIPMGFTFDEYISETNFDKIAQSKRHLALLKAMVLSDEQIVKYSDIIGKALTDGESFRYTGAEYFGDCKERQSLTCTSFEYTNSGFNATADLTAEKSDKLMFFSVPFEKGWSATVNGESVDVEKVSVGFMAVRVKAGQVNEIEFTYKTPGLQLGLIISGAAVLAFAVYMLLGRGKWEKKPTRRSFVVK